MFLRECSCGISLVFTVNPLLTPPPLWRGLIYFKPIWGGLLETGLIWQGGLFNVETTMVSVLREELEYKVDKLKYKTF